MKHKIFALALVLVTASSLMSCASNYSTLGETVIVTKELNLGDHLVVFEKSGRVLDMVLTMIEGDTLHGTRPDNLDMALATRLSSPLEIQVEIYDIARIEMAGDVVAVRQQSFF